MSQQAFEPQQNERPFHTTHDNTVQENVQESEARPYYWSTRPNTGNIPKNEHPANFEDSIADMPPYSYQAQDRVAQETYATTPPLQSRQHSQQRQRQQFSPDGDAMEHGYWPYGSYSRQVPPWARPQGGNKSARVILFVVLGFILMKPLLFLLGTLLVFASVAFVLVLFVGLAAVAMLIVFAALGRPLPFGLFRSRHRGRVWH